MKILCSISELFFENKVICINYLLHIKFLWQ
jgi:hypothetical protein